MNDLEKLKFHLSNLQKQGQTEFIVNVKWLLSIIENLPKDTKISDYEIIDIDGGKF
tara:strand:- start:221 stop:388 length:168 start_codon:yes stop_codon:yes gene_type:complete